MRMACPLKYSMRGHTRRLPGIVYSTGRCPEVTVPLNIGNKDPFFVSFSQQLA